MDQISLILLAEYKFYTLPRANTSKISQYVISVKKTSVVVQCKKEKQIQALKLRGVWIDPKVSHCYTINLLDSENKHDRLFDTVVWLQNVDMMDDVSPVDQKSIFWIWCWALACGYMDLWDSIHINETLQC